MASLDDRGRFAAWTATLLIAIFTIAGCGVFGLSGKATSKGASDGGRESLAWPLEGPISSGYGPRGKTHHDGLDISAPEGTPVKAAASGTVIFSGSLRGYGTTVIIEHHATVTTVYAHLSEKRVKAGDSVRSGQVIATVGRTGKTTGPNLHFEVRRNKVAQDPVAFLPARSSSMFAKKEAPAPKKKGVGYGG